MNANVTSSGTLKRITGLVKLEGSRFRKAFLTLLAIAVAFLLIAGQALGLPPIDGLATAAIVTVVLVSLMLDYIIQWVGPAAMEVYRNDKPAALDRQIDFVKNKKPAFVKRNWSGVVSSLSDGLISRASELVRLAGPVSYSRWVSAS